MRRLRSTIRHIFSKRAAVVAVVIGVSVCGVGAMAYALTSASPAAPPSGATAGGSASTSSVPPASAAAGGVSAGGGSASGVAATGARRRIAVRLLKLVGSSVQGQLVVPLRGGGYRTVYLDKGDISSLSSTAITVDPLNGASPVTAAITSETREPKKVSLSTGEEVTLVSSGGNALLIRPVDEGVVGSAGSQGSSGSSGSTGTTGTTGTTGVTAGTDAAVSGTSGQTAVA